MWAGCANQMNIHREKSFVISVNEKKSSKSNKDMTNVFNI